MLRGEEGRRFIKISRSRRSFWFSDSNSRLRLRRALSSAASATPDRPWRLLIQHPSAPGCTPRFLAASGTVRPCSVTIFTADLRNSGLYAFLAIVDLLGAGSNPASACPPLVGKVTSASSSRSWA